ncbi:hypothetical protein Brsp04_01895 [Brucella sp. NBRC 12952]|uniref:Uncharacterized protein n=1 Tax=Brucella pseudogrignonensis TaxID=419475 RepID=A0A7Y3T549_9HYPH|nr:hypothetical protein [Brucella pseudogrignonensis]NNV19412.1 hypothetical protein [Brucella pseudogrignonensis]
MANQLIAIDTVGREIKARVEAGDKAIDKAEQHYIAAGIQLLEAQKRLKETREMRWSAFLFSHVRLSDETARKYMMLANGDATLEEIREKKAKSERERRAKAKASASVPKHIENSNHVVGKIHQQNQQISNSSARVARIVAALSAADDDTLSKIEALLNITEENVNG